MDRLQTFADLPSNDHRIDGIFLIRVFLGLTSDIFDALIVTWILKFNIVMLAPLLFYLVCLSVFTAITFFMIPLTFYSQYGFLFFKAVSTCHMIFLSVVIHFEDKSERRSRRHRHVIYIYSLVHIFLNVGESLKCAFVK